MGFTGSIFTAKPVKSKGPCCRAMSSRCLACSKGVSEKIFCKTNPGKYGCPGSSPIKFIKQTPKPVTLPVKKDCDKEWTNCVYETFNMRHCSNEKRKCLGKGEEAQVQEWLQLADREEAEKPAEEENEEAPEEEDDERFEEIQEQLDNPNETGEG